MKRRLILFSGGVESTALLTIADKKDLLLICDIPRKDFVGGLDHTKCRTIAAIYGNEYIEFKFPVRIEGKQWMHQINWFIFACHLVAESRGDISEVWLGMHHDESYRVNNYHYPIDRRRILEKCMTAWHVLQPKIKFLIPLEFETKDKQWQRIPDNVKKYVNWCNHNNDCGVCRKCLEFKKYCGEMPTRNTVSPKKELREVVYNDRKKFLSNFLNIKGNA